MAGAKKFMCIFLVFAAVVAPPAEAAINCGQVFSYLRSCYPYVSGRGPLGRCCGGVKGLYNAARTTGDKQIACRCLKDLVNSHSGINQGKAAGLPGQCGVRLPYRISRSTICSRIR